MKKILKDVFIFLCGFGSCILTKFLKKPKSVVSNVDKFKSYYRATSRWILLKQEKVSLADYFKCNNIHTIAIYGMGEIGTLLVNELKETDIIIKYAIDRAVGNNFGEFPIIKQENLLDSESVDCIVVTPIFDFISIKEQLSKIKKFNVLSLEDIIFSL